MDWYLGEIRMFAGTFAPDGWHLCDGSTLPVRGNEALYALIGNIWGGTAQTMALPDLRGRVPVGQGSGQSNYVLAQTGGSEVVTLTEAQAPAHSHDFNITDANATTSTPGPTVTFASAPTGTLPYLVKGAAGTVAEILSTVSVSNVGANQSHSNIMPSLAINFIIAITGLMPPRP